MTPSAPAATTSSKELRNALPGVDVWLRSVGDSAAAEASIIVGGVSVCPNQPGLNLVTLDSAQHVAERALFRTGR